MPPVKDLRGQRFGRLTVIERAPNAANGAIRWKSRCDCGNDTISWKKTLLDGRAQSCGCLHREIVQENSRKHGKCGTQVWKAWQNMLNRAARPTRERERKYYTSRGIAVWPEWVESFQAFYDEVGDPPGPGLTLDRIDNNRGYEPGNIRWATRKEQIANSRSRQRRTHCHRGHPFTMSAPGRQVCLICKNEARKRRLHN